MSGARLIRLEQVGVSFRRRTGFLRARDFWAVRDVTFDIFEGETLGIVGRNGSGKSSLLKVIARIIAPDRGTVTMPESCRASLLALLVGFNPYLTGRENALLSGMFHGLTREQVRQRLPEILEFAELAEFADVPVGTYSVGMKARLGFAIALHADPDVLLIDEVLGVGDGHFRLKSTRVMKDRIRSNKTVVLVSHNADTLRELCDRVAWIEDGSCVAIGAPDTVLRDYEQALAEGPAARRRAAAARTGSASPPGATS